jgi:hypothetical protein
MVKPKRPERARRLSGHHQDLGRGVQAEIAARIARTRRGAESEAAAPSRFDLARRLLHLRLRGICREGQGERRQ